MKHTFFYMLILVVRQIGSACSFSVLPYTLFAGLELELVAGVV